MAAGHRPGSRRRWGCWVLSLVLLLPPVLLLWVAAGWVFGEPESFPRQESCQPTLDWASRATCSATTREEGLQYFEGYEVEAGVPTRDFCRSFLDSPGKGRRKACRQPADFEKVACGKWGIREEASCFVCSERRKDQSISHLRAFADDCSLGLSIHSIEAGLHPSMCPVKASPLCVARPRKKGT